MDEALFNAAIFSNNAGEGPYKHNCQDLIADVNDNYCRSSLNTCRQTGAASNSSINGYHIRDYASWQQKNRSLLHKAMELIKVMTQ